MTDELLVKATRLRSEIENVRYNLKRIEDWEGQFRRMANDLDVIPEELKGEITEYVSTTLKEKYSKNLEKLEKEFADL